MRDQSTLLGTPLRISTGPTSTFVPIEFPNRRARTALSGIARAGEMDTAAPLTATPHRPSGRIWTRTWNQAPVRNVVGATIDSLNDGRPSMTRTLSPYAKPSDVGYDTPQAGGSGLVRGTLPWV